MRFYEFKQKLDVPTLTVNQLVKKHSVPKEQILSQLKKGMKVELEHTTDADIAKEIALDHLSEFPDYYDRLAKAETNESARHILDESEKLFPKLIEDILQVVPEAKEIWFHGSRATGTHRRNSDWDILIVVDQDTLKDRNYLDIVISLRPLNAKYKNFDIQASNMKSFPGSVLYWAREEGRLLWKDSNVAESASGYIPSEKEKNDPRYKTGLTKDVKPDTIQVNAKKLGSKVSRAGIPPLLR
jgi:predicted nucleotidyltransferase